MMLRPRWVLALLAALAVAAGFALLGQWQVERAVEEATVVERPTEEIQQFATAVQAPDTPTEQLVTGQRVRVEGTWVPGDTVLIEGRLNGGVAGFWPVAHLEVADAAPGGLPVALGWAADEKQARAAIDQFEASIDADVPVQLEGRFLPSEAPTPPDQSGDPHEMTTVAVAQLINLWAAYDDRPVYFGYITLADAAPGLDTIDSPAPLEESNLNWLNVFYALEWVVFAGFAIYLWYRLVRDAVEREALEAEETATASAAAANRAPDDET